MYQSVCLVQVINQLFDSYQRAQLSQSAWYRLQHIFVRPSPSSSGHPHLHPAILIFIRPSPSSSGRTTHIIQSIRLDPPDLTGLCLTLFLDSRMFSFHNRMFLHVLSSSTFYLRLDPRSSILILVTYPHLSDSGSH